MNRKVQILAIASLGFLVSTVMHTTQTWSSNVPTVLSGAIQFPSSIKKTPSIRIYFAGSKIASTAQNDRNQTAFSVTPHQSDAPLYLLVTESLHWHAEENTIKNLRVNRNNSYRFYCLRPLNTSKKDSESGPFWHIQEVTLDANGNVPDNTIVVILNPEWIDTIKGGDSITLPTLHVQSDILEAVGSETALHATTEELLLSAIDSDTIHKKVNQIIKPHYNAKAVLALTT